MSEKMDVAIALPVIVIAGAAAAATAAAAISAGKAAQATFGNENLRKAVQDLFPNVRVEGTSLTVKTPEGLSMRFRPQGNRYRPEPIGVHDADKFRQTTGRIVQRFALLQIRDVAKRQGMAVAEETAVAGGVLRLRLRAETVPGETAAEVSAELKTDGNVSLETHGIKGPACSKLLEPIVEALGNPRRREQTAEYYERVRDASSEHGRERA